MSDFEMLSIVLSILSIILMILIAYINEIITTLKKGGSNCRQSPHVKVWTLFCFWCFHSVKSVCFEHMQSSEMLNFQWFYGIMI